MHVSEATRLRLNVIDSDVLIEGGPAVPVISIVIVYVPKVYMSAVAATNEYAPVEVSKVIVGKESSQKS